MSEQPLDLRVTAAALKRRKLTLVFLALIGLAAGIAYGVLRPPSPSATALIYVPPPAITSATDSTSDISTQILIATSTPVLEAAGKAVSPPLDPLDLKSRVQISAPSQQILQVRVKAPDGQSAQQLANAVAAEYARLATTLSGGSIGGQPHVIQSATINPVARNTKLVTFGAIGLAAGLLVGGLTVLVRFRRDPRLRLRDEMARALGLPVLGSVNAEERKTVAGWTKLLEQYRPSSVDAWNLRRVVHRLVPDGADTGTQVCVVSLAHDLSAVAAGVQMCVFAGSLGMSTALYPQDHEALVRLRAAGAARGVSGDSATSIRPWDGLSAIGQDDQRLDVRSARSQLLLSILVVDETRPEVGPFGGTCVLAISSGFASAETLARTALAVSDAGHVIEGILVVNPDPGDNTTGSVPESSYSRPVSLANGQSSAVWPATGVST